MPHEIQLIQPRHVRNRSYHVAGIALMAANAVRHRVRGYRTPRPARVHGLEAALRYDRAVVANWFRFLSAYDAGPVDLTGRRVLEIGPGPDVGVGLMMLAQGAASYLGVDAHPLLRESDASLQRELLRRIAVEDCEGDTRRRKLEQALENFLRGRPTTLEVRQLPGFDLGALPSQSADLVVSHSSFEHLTDPGTTIAQLRSICRPGARLVAEIDLQTHTRWIRDADPLNIYRYPSTLYRALRYSGMPNRRRPDEYLQWLEGEGWEHPRLYPQRVLDPGYVRRVEPTLAAAFRGDPEHLGWMTVVLCARKRREQRPRSQTE